MEAKHKTILTKKKMKQQILSKATSMLLRGILGVALLGLVASCRQEDPNQAAPQTHQESKGGMVYLNLDDIELDPEVAIRYASSTTQSRGIEMTTPSTGRKLPTFDFAPMTANEEPFPVVLAMVGYTQDVDCYARATWKLIKQTDAKTGKTRYFVRAKGPMQFDREPDYRKLKEGEIWYLHALYAPGGTWDAATATWKYQASRVVKKLYGANEKLTIGTDIDIPFVLGHNVDPNNASTGWREGYTLVAARDSKSSSGWAFGMEQMYKNDKTSKANPRFKMQGSLYAFTLRNDMAKNESTAGLDGDDLTVSRLQYRPTYDYQLKGFYVESTQSTTAVSYAFNTLRMRIPEASRQMLIQALRLPANAINMIAHPYKIKATPTTVPTRENPTRVFYKLTNPVDLNRQTTSGTFYFWMNEVDENSTISTNDLGYGMSISADLYNKTISREVGMVNVYHTTKTHKSGTFYSTNVKLKEELRLNPMARMGYDYLVGDPRRANDARFARSTAGNGADPNWSIGDPGAGQLYAAFRGTSPALQDFDRSTFQVSYTYDRSGSNANAPVIETQNSDLMWNVPDRYDVFSVFPYSVMEESKFLPKDYPGILYNPEASRMGWNANEQVRLDGKRETVTSYYYRQKKAVYTDQVENISENVFYAFRFVGTPYATVFRYREIGKWHIPSGPNHLYGVSKDKEPSRESRLVIESKSIGNHGSFKNVNPAQAEEFLRDVVAKTEFWEENSLQRGEILRRSLHVNGDKVGGEASGVGQRMHFWTRRLKDQNTRKVLYREDGNPGVYYDMRSNDKGLYWAVANGRILGGQIGTRGGATGSYVLPWLSVHQPNRK